MMTAYLLISLKGILVLAAALGVARPGRFTAAVRHLILVSAMLSLPALLLLDTLSPPTILVAPPALDLAWTTTVQPTVAGATSSSADATELQMDVSPAHLYVLVSAVLLLYWLIRVGMTCRWVARTRLLAEQIPGSGSMHRGLTLRQSERSVSPVTWGVLRPVVVVPGDWERWGRRKQQAAMAHEAAHVRRLDVLTSLTCAVIASLFWANPLVWIARRRILQEAEQACDDAVVSQGAAPTRYASDLLEITRSRERNREPYFAAAMATTSTLSRRIRALVDPDTRRTPMTVPQAASVLTLVLALVLGLGAVGAHSAGTAATDGTDVPPMSEQVYQGLSDVQELVEAAEYELALAEVDELLQRPQSLNRNERAQIHNMRGYVHFMLGGYRQAVQDYQAVLTQSGAIPAGLETQTLYTLAQLSFVLDQYPQAIEYIEAWMQRAADPGPIPYVFTGQVHLHLGDYPAALWDVRKGIQLAQKRGIDVQESWQKLEDYLQSVIDNGGRTADVLNAGREVDGDYLPVVKVAAVYPAHARQQRIEGYVDVEFTVSSTGRVTNPVVVGADPAGVFDRAALNAVSRFKYKPRVSDGKPVEVAGVRNRITFELED